MKVTQVLWGYTFVLSVIYLIAQVLGLIFRIKCGILTITLFIIFIIIFKIKPMVESDSPIAFKIENRRRSI
jgi:nucleoside recognition membrane protein YjiH